MQGGEQSTRREEQSAKGIECRAELHSVGERPGDV